jgi:hypothetical protein
VVVHELTDTTNLSLALKHLLEIKQEGLLLTKLAGIKGSRRKWPVWCGVQGLGGCKQHGTCELPPKTTTLFPSGPPLPSFLGWGLSRHSRSSSSPLYSFFKSLVCCRSALFSSHRHIILSLLLFSPSQQHLISSSKNLFFCFSDHLTFLASSHLESTCHPPLDASSQYFVNNVGGKENIPCQLVLSITLTPCGTLGARHTCRSLPSPGRHARHTVQLQQGSLDLVWLTVTVQPTRAFNLLQISLA